MPYEYSDPTRESDPHALPDLEVFYRSELAVRNDARLDAVNGCACDSCWTNGDGEPLGAGWFYAYGFPGCLWDSDPVGPFDTEAEALADAREGLED